MFNRRCGVLSYVVLAILALLVCAPIALPQAVTMVQSSTRSAGSSAPGYNSDLGPATTVNLSNPSYIVFDSNGNQFISDTLNNCVRKIDTAGHISTVAGLSVGGQSDTCNTSSNSTPTAAQGLYQPTGLAIDSTNRLYIADSGHNCVRALISGDFGVAKLTTVAGTCGSVPTASVTPAPNGLAIDAANNLYISLQDSISATPVYQVVRHAIGATASNVCLVAGAASANVATACAGTPNGIALVRPSGLAMNVNGDLYIADTGNNCIRKVAGVDSGSATQSTAVGQCLNDATGNAATAVHNPYGLAVSPMQSLFISESNPDNIVSYIPGSSSVKVIGGLPSGVAGPYDATQDGKSALNAPLSGARGLVFDNVARLFVADSLNNIVREFSSDLYFSNTPVGSPSVLQPITFVINQPVNLTASIGTDYSITSTTCAGSLTPAAAGAAPITCQVFVRFTPTRPGVRRSPLKIIDSVSNTSIFEGLQGIGTGALSIFTPGIQSTIATGLVSPTSTVTDAAGNAYVLENATSSGTPDVRFIPAGGGPASSIISNLTSPTAIAQDGAGNTYVADSTHGTVSRFGADGSVNVNYVTGLDTPVALFVDLFNNLYIAQAGSSHNVIISYTSGARRVIAGNGGSVSADGVPATSAAFVSPSSITMGINGILYIADQGGHRVYAVDQSEIIHIAAGNGGTATTLAGQAIGTALVAPSSLTIDAAGDLYIADQGTGTIYAVSTSSTTGDNIFVVLNTSTPPAANGALSIALDGSSNLFISENANNSVVELSHPNPTLDFGPAAIGSSSAIMHQNVANVGTDSLNITSALSTTDSHFAVDSGTTTCGTTISAGSICALGFTFTPTANATYNANSIVSSNSYNTPQTVALTGTGKLMVNPSLNLIPQVEVYGRAFTETVVFTNLTSAPTGTITFTVGSQTLCTLSGSLASATTCNAAVSGLSVGTYTVTFNYTGDSNYNSAAGTVTLNVTPAPLSEVVNNATCAFGSTNPAFSGSLTGVASGDTILVAYSTTATIASPVGDFPITATLTPAGTTNLSNYTITNTPATLDITQATPTYILPGQTEIYGQPFAEIFTINGAVSGVPTTGSISFAINGKTNFCTLTGTYAATTTCNAPNSGLAVGVYSVTFNYSGDANYAAYSGQTTLTVTPAALTIAIANATRPYGASNPAFTGTISGALAGDTFTQAYFTQATITSPIGTYNISESLTGAAASNYIVTVVPGTLTITKAAIGLNVAVSSASRFYGAANPTFTSITTGALNGDTFTVSYSTAATTMSPVGTYPISATVSGAALGNYTLTLTANTLTVVPTTLTISANNASRSYGIANPALNGTITGLINGDTVTVNYLTTAALNSPAGTYPIVPTVTGAALSNYSLSVVNGTLSITANGNALLIKVNSAARVFGAPNPAFSGTVTGVLPGDNVVVTYGTSATTASSAGTYPISASVSGTSASNYIATIDPGTLAVTPASTITTVMTSAPSVNAGSSVTFTANVTGTPTAVAGVVTFFDGTVMLGNGTLKGNGVATFTTSSLSVGAHNIAAAFQANTNFTTSAATISQIVTQATGGFTVTANPPTPYLNGAGTTTFTVTVSANGAFAGPVALTCSGLPSDAGCAFANPTVTITAGGSVTTTMTVTTTAADARLLASAGLPANPADLAPLTVATILPIELTSLGVFCAGLRRRKALGTRKTLLLLLIVCTLGILGLTGCGASPSMTFQTYTINITGTSLSFPCPAQTASVVLSVGRQ